MTKVDELLAWADYRQFFVLYLIDGTGGVCVKLVRRCEFGLETAKWNDIELFFYGNNSELAASALLERVKGEK